MELSLSITSKPLQSRGEYHKKQPNCCISSQPAPQQSHRKSWKKVWMLHCLNAGRDRSVYQPWGGSTTNMCPRHFRYWKPEKKLEEMKQTSAETVSIASPVAGSIAGALIYNFFALWRFDSNQYYFYEGILEK